MKIDLGFPALALVATQDTAGILRRTSGTGFLYCSNGNLLEIDTTPCSVYAGDVSLVVSGSRSSRAAIFAFLGCFFGRYLILSMFECHVKFERIFDKIFEPVS